MKSSRPMSVQLLKATRYVTVSVPTAEGGQEKIRVDIRKELSLTSGSMDSILQNHPQQAFFWNHARQTTISMVRKAEDQYEQTRSRYYLSYRHVYTDKGKAFTDKTLEAEVYSDDNVTKARSKLDALRDQLGLLTAICDSFEHRRWMLTQMSGVKRAKAF